MHLHKQLDNTFTELFKMPVFYSFQKRSFLFSQIGNSPIRTSFINWLLASFSVIALVQLLTDVHALLVPSQIQAYW